MPGTLPFHMQHEAPRLKERSVISRIAFCALGLACCGGVIVAFCSMWQFWMPDQTAATGMGIPLAAQNNGPTTYVSVHGPTTHHRKAPIQRSVIQRLSMLKRAPGARGVDMHWIAQMFPHWIEEDATGNGGPQFNVQSTLSDLVLAVAYLAQAEVED